MTPLYLLGALGNCCLKDLSLALGIFATQNPPQLHSLKILRGYYKACLESKEDVESFIKPGIWCSIANAEVWNLSDEKTIN